MSPLIKVAGAVGFVVVLCSGCTKGSAATSQPGGVAPMTTSAAASLFLDNYVDTDGRVVRHDQGADTVSEGQAYAMLLDVATGNRNQFSAVWGWALKHLMQPDGLLAYHWDDGKVLDPHSASDADLDTARALILAGEKWSNQSWSQQGKAYAQSILANEAVVVGGRLWLVAGPWARSRPYYVDPSYFDPATFGLLANATGDLRWNQVEESSNVVVTADTSGGTRLPSDWAEVTASGGVVASPAPGDKSIVYGYDAFRTLVRQADERDGARVGLDRKLLPLAVKTAAEAGGSQVFAQDGDPVEAGADPLMDIAAAGAAAAAGQSDMVDHYLSEAADAEADHQSYYLDAWVALGRVLLTTSLLIHTPNAQEAQSS